MMQEAVRDTGLEGQDFDLVNGDAGKIWNVAGLVRQFGCSRGKIDKALVALEVQGKVSVERLVGNSWIVRVIRQPPSDDGGRNGKRARGT
jgi:hypothetical protein